jgi:hypothetical protein
MRRREGGDGDKREGDAGECAHRPEIRAVAHSSACERLDYIAAMILELKMTSAQADRRTLTSLLEMAYQEALQRRPRRQSGQ